MQVDAAVDIAKRGFGSDEKTVGLLRKIYEECAALQDPDRCEAAYKRYMCEKEGAKKNGLLSEKWHF